MGLGIVGTPFIPALGFGAEAGRSVSLRPASFTYQVSGHPELHRETLSQKTKQQDKTKQKTQKMIDGFGIKLKL